MILNCKSKNEQNGEQNGIEWELSWIGSLQNGRGKRVKLGHYQEKR